MSNTMKNIVGILVLAGIAYFAYTYVFSLTESEVYAQSKEMIIENNKDLYEAKFTNKGLYGSYMLHIKIKRKDNSLTDYYVVTQMECLRVQEAQKV